MSEPIKPRLAIGPDLSPIDAAKKALARALEAQAPGSCHDHAPTAAAIDALIRARLAERDATRTTAQQPVATVLAEARRQISAEDFARRIADMHGAADEPDLEEIITQAREVCGLPVDHNPARKAKAADRAADRSAGLAFRLEIECENDAFGGSRYERAEEVTRILADIVKRSRAGAPGAVDLAGTTREHAARCIDANGNVVGRYWWTE